MSDLATARAELHTTARRLGLLRGQVPGIDGEAAGYAGEAIRVATAPWAAGHTVLRTALVEAAAAAPPALQPVLNVYATFWFELLRPPLQGGIPFPGNAATALAVGTKAALAASRVSLGG